MKVELKTWTQLGVATALVGAGLSGCADEADTGAEPAASASQSGEMGEGGEGGETGEGGVSVADAARDPVVYNTALAVAEAHAIAARDAFAAGRTDAAAEMFAHPISEVLADMDPVFEERGVGDFKPLFEQASRTALDGDSEARVENRFDAIITALRDASEKAPENGLSDAAVSGAVAADMIDRAAAMYREAGSSDRYEPYLDGYGFYKTAQRRFDTAHDGLEDENRRLHDSIEEALTLLERAYPGVERPVELNADQSELLAIASQVMLRRLPGPRG